MPLIAQSRSTGEKISVLDFNSADEIRSKHSPDDLICPHCQKVMMIRQTNVLYFEHLDCGTKLSYERSTATHLTAKSALFKNLEDEFKNYNCTISCEAAVPELNRIVDFLIEFPLGYSIIYEILFTPHDIPKIKEKYNNAITAGYDIAFFLCGGANTQENREWFVKEFGNCLYLDFKVQTVERSKSNPVANS